MVLGSPRIDVAVKAALLALLLAVAWAFAAGGAWSKPIGDIAPP